METVFARLTVYFEDPFWVGVYERQEGGALTACRIVFGAEPRDHEVYALLLQGWHRLRFGPAVEGEAPAEACKNPKRQQRAIRRALARKPGETRARQAVQAAREWKKQSQRMAMAR